MQERGDVDGQTDGSHLADIRVVLCMCLQLTWTLVRQIWVDILHVEHACMVCTLDDIKQGSIGVVDWNSLSGFAVTPPCSIIINRNTLILMIIDQFG